MPNSIPPPPQNVPNGWTSHFDFRYNRYYFIETATGKSQWEFPTPSTPLLAAVRNNNTFLTTQPTTDEAPPPYTAFDESALNSQPDVMPSPQVPNTNRPATNTKSDNSQTTSPLRAQIQPLRTNSGNYSYSSMPGNAVPYASSSSQPAAPYPAQSLSAPYPPQTSQPSYPLQSGYQPGATGYQPGAAGYQPGAAGYQPGAAVSFPPPPNTLGAMSMAPYPPRQHQGAQPGYPGYAPSGPQYQPGNTYYVYQNPTPVAPSQSVVGPAGLGFGLGLLSAGLFAGSRHHSHFGHSHHHHGRRW